MKRAKIPWLSRVSYRYEILPHRGWQTSPESVATFKRNGWQPSTGMGGNLGPEYSAEALEAFFTTNRVATGMFSGSNPGGVKFIDFYQNLEYDVLWFIGHGEYGPVLGN